MTETTTLLIERRDAVVAGFLNRAEVHNALDTSLRGALAEFWEMVRDTASIRVALIAGVSGASFSAGRDLKETARAYGEGQRGAEWELAKRSGYPVDTVVGKPIVAAIDRYCMGAGLKIAIDCDIRIATADARFGTPQVRVGRGTESPIYLRKAGIPAAVVNDMVFTGEPLNAEQALRYGLVSRIVERESLIEEGWRIAATIAAGSPAVVQGAKRGMDIGVTELPTALAGPVWRDVTGMFGDTEDAKTGAAAFSTKQKASF